MTVETNLDVLLEAGTLLVIKHGSYSDAVTHEPVRVIKAVTLRELADRFKASWLADVETRRQRDGDYFDENEDREYGPGEPLAASFLPWLVRSGYVEDAGNVRTWDIGDYRAFVGG